MQILIPTAEVARQLRVSSATITRMVTRGDLPAAQKLQGPRGAYLFDPEVVARFAESRRRDRDAAQIVHRYRNGPEAGDRIRVGDSVKIGASRAIWTVTKCSIWAPDGEPFVEVSRQQGYVNRVMIGEDIGRLHRVAEACPDCPAPGRGGVSA